MTSLGTLGSTIMCSLNKNANLTTNNNITTVLHVMDMLSCHFLESKQYNLATIRHAFFSREEQRRLSAFEYLTDIRTNFCAINKDTIASMLGCPLQWESKPDTRIGSLIQMTLYKLSSRKSELLKLCDGPECMELIFENINELHPHLSKLSFSDLHFSHRLLDDISCYMEANHAIHDLLKRGANIQAAINFTNIPRKLIFTEMFTDIQNKRTGDIPKEYHMILQKKMNNINVDKFDCHEEMSLQERMELVYFFTSETDRYLSFSSIQYILRGWLRIEELSGLNSRQQNKIIFMCKLFSVNYHVSY